MKSKLTKSQLEVENARLRHKINEVSICFDCISKEFVILKIMAYLRNNGVKQEMVDLLATDVYKMVKGDL
jgi:thiamine biosynthesis lipoprotein ApbE